MTLLDVDLFTTKVAGEVFAFSRDVALQHERLRNENENCLNNLSKENDFFAFECAPLFVGNQSLEDTLNAHILPVVTKTCMKVLEQGVSEQVILGVLKDFFKEKRLLHIVPHTEVFSDQDSLMDILTPSTQELASWRSLLRSKNKEEPKGVFLWQDLDNAKVNMKTRYGQLLEERRLWAQKQRNALTHEQDQAAEEKKDDADVARNNLYRLHLARCLRSSFTQDALKTSLATFVHDVCETLEGLARAPNPALAGLGIHWQKEYETLRKEKPCVVPQVYPSFFDNTTSSTCLNEVSCWAFRRVSFSYLLLTSDVEHLPSQNFSSSLFDPNQREQALPLYELVLRWDKNKQEAQEASGWNDMFEDDLYVGQTYLYKIVETLENEKKVESFIQDDTKEICMMISDMVLDRLWEELRGQACMYKYDAQDLENMKNKPKLAHLKIFGNNFEIFMGMYGKELSYRVFGKTQEYLATYSKEQVWGVYKQNLPQFIEECKNDIRCEKTLEQDEDFLQTPLTDFFLNNDKKLALLHATHKPALFKHR